MSCRLCAIHNTTGIILHVICMCYMLYVIICYLKQRFEDGDKMLNEKIVKE